VGGGLAADDVDHVPSATLTSPRWRPPRSRLQAVRAGARPSRPTRTER